MCRQVFEHKTSVQNKHNYFCLPLGVTSILAGCSPKNVVNQAHSQELIMNQMNRSWVYSLELDSLQELKESSSHSKFQLLGFQRKSNFHHDHQSIHRVKRAQSVVLCLMSSDFDCKIKGVHWVAHFHTCASAICKVFKSMYFLLQILSY